MATDHPYYCEDNGYNDIYNSVDDFLEVASEIDPDCNLLVRYDYIEESIDVMDADSPTRFVLKIYFLLQRKSYVWSIRVYDIKEDDIPKINEYLKSKFEHLCKLWN